MIIFIIIGMAVVTMVPRFIPAFIVNNIVFKDWINNWLQSIPYAALGALIFPAVLTVKEGSPQIGLVGALVAVILSRSEEHTSELQSRGQLVCRPLPEK